MFFFAGCFSVSLSRASFVEFDASFGCFVFEGFERLRIFIVVPGKGDLHACGVEGLGTSHLKLFTCEASRPGSRTKVAQRAANLEVFVRVLRHGNPIQGSL